METRDRHRKRCVALVQNRLMLRYVCDTAQAQGRARQGKARSVERGWWVVFFLDL
jgi:hypothetical protein